MLTKDAVIKVLNDEGITPYRLAKNIGVQPIMINNYIGKGTSMGVKTAAKFTALYSIDIDDIFDNRKIIDGALATPNSSK